MDTYKFIIFTDSIPTKAPKDSVIIFQGGGGSNVYTSMEQYIEQKGDIEEHILHRNVFVARGDTFPSSIDFRISEPNIPRDSIFVKSEETIEDILRDIKKDSLKTYDIFSGGNIDGFEKKTIVKQIKILFYITYNYMSAGYHLGKNDRKIPDWCICFSDPILEYFIAYFEIPTESPDITVVDQFLTTPQFRKMVTIQFLKVLSNYSINNHLIDISKVESWENMRMWEGILKKL